MNAWLRCKLNTGMFSDEVAVTYPSSAGAARQISVFIPRSYVRGDEEGQGEVLVDVGEMNGTCYAVLPNSYRDIVWPDAADLSRS